MQPRELSRILGLVAALFGLVTSPPVMAQSVIFDVNTNHPTDTIYLGNPAEIVFDVDAGPYQLQGIQFSLAATYTNGLAIGPMAIGDNLHFSPYAAATFVSLYLHPFHTDVEVPDTMLFSGVSFAGPWIGADGFAKIEFSPQDTGTIVFDTVLVAPANVTSAFLPSGASPPLDWRPGPIVVAPCPWLVGDLNDDGVITLGDIILLVNYVFKSGAPPQPYELMGDADCSQEVTTGDIIYLINYQGKGGPEPCPCFIPPG